MLAGLLHSRLFREPGDIFARPPRESRRGKSA
jgi:aquaporin Z